MPASWRQHCTIWATSLVLGVAAWFYVGNRTPDFSVFHLAVTHWPGPIYDPSFMDSLQGGRNYPWAYPPTFLLILYPLRWLSLQAAFAIWTAISTAAFLAATYRIAGRWAPLILLSPLYLLTAVNGQTSLLLGGLVVGGLVAKDWWLSGALLGLAACIKPHLVLPLVPLGLLVGGRWRDAVAMAVTGAGLCLLSALMFGVETWGAWLGSLSGFLARNGELGLLGIAPNWLPLRLALAAASVVLVWRAFRADDRELQILSALGGTMTFSPHVMAYDLAIIAPAAFAMALRSKWWAPLHVVFLLRLLTAWPLLAAYLAAAAIQDRADRPIALSPRPSRERHRHG